MKKGRTTLFIMLAVMMSLILTVGCKPKVTETPTSSTAASSEEASSAAVSSEEASTASSEEVSATSSEEVSMTSSTAASTAGSSTAATSSKATSSKATSSKATSTAYSGKTGVKVDPKTLTGRVADLKGRTITVNINQAIDYTTMGGKARKARDEELMKQYNCKIVYRLQHNETGGNYEIVNSVLAGKPLVDIWVQNGVLEVIPHYRAGVIQGLNKLKVFDWSEYSAMYVLSRFGGEQYTVQAKINPKTGTGYNPAWVTHVLWYNQKLLDDYGITDNISSLMSSGQWTWDKWEQICVKFNQNSAGAQGGLLKACWEWNEVYDMLLGSYKANWVNLNTDTGIYSFGAGSANAQKALTHYKKLVTSGAITLENTSKGLDAAFGKGEAAFLFRFLAGMRWGFGDTGIQTVKDNFNFATIPTVATGSKQAITYVAAGGYAIPVGIVRPNEAATILDQWMLTDINYEDAKESFIQVNVLPQINDRNGDDMLEKIDWLYDFCAKEDKNSWYLYSSFTINTNPGIGNWTVGNNDSWYTHTRAIAAGTEAMGTTITSMTPFYNKILADFTKAR